MKIVHFGAGNIGRGAIPEIFNNIYDQLIFIDPDQELVNKINHTKEYVIKKTNPLVVKNFYAINSNDIDEVLKAINSCDLISTSCGFNNLESVAKIINQSDVLEKTYIISFENNVRPSSHLKKFIVQPNNFIFVDCIIDRIVPNQVDSNSLDVFVEDYLKVIIENHNYDLKYFKNCQVVDQLEEYITLKLFGVNGLHYILAILGFNKGYEYIKDVINDNIIIEKVNFYIQCLIKYIVSTTNINHDFVDNYLKNNLKRFLNIDLIDECSRVARNSILKLESNNRVIPIIKFVLDSQAESQENKVMIKNLLKDLYSYNNNLDEDSQVIQKAIQEIGLEATILKFSELRL